MENPIATEKNLGSTIADLVGGVTLPAPIRRNLIKVVGQLMTAAIDIPVALLEGRASEFRAESEARVQIIKSSSNQIAERLSVDEAYVRAAANKFGRRIVKEQLTLDEISSRAIKKLAENKPTSIESDELDRVTEISDEFLQDFEAQARQVSHDEIKELFANILAKEITDPHTFTKRTLSVVSQLDSDTAKLFQSFCSCCISLEHDKQIIDVRVAGFGNAGSNTLAPFSFSFDNLNRLNEVGLIIPDYNSMMDYAYSIIANNSITFPLRYVDKNYALRPISDPIKSLKILTLPQTSIQF